MFRDLFPRFPEKEVPIGHVTNGVHVPSWDSIVADDLWKTHCGQERWLGKTEMLPELVRKISDAKFWDFRKRSRTFLIEYVRRRLAKQLAARGVSTDAIEWAKTCFNPEVLTLGFARRFAEYKRTNLLLMDEERLVRILNQAERPVQLILAGKAHPADREGHALIRRWMEFIQRPDVRPSVIFLSDYDMVLTEYLVQGVDVWINTPRRPWEASGTSGMKVLVNGGLNLSELDGWWAEAYCPEVGWALGDRKEHGSDSEWDRQEANALYDLLEQQVVPAFYTRDKRGIPSGWICKMRESMARLTPQFSSNRVVREYTERFYLPAAENFAKRSADVSKLAEWKRRVETEWGNLQFGEVKCDGTIWEVQVRLGALKPQDVQVQLYSETGVIPMDYKGMAGEWHRYQKEGTKGVPQEHITPRILPSNPSVALPLECPLILWQK